MCDCADNKWEVYLLKCFLHKASLREGRGDFCRRVQPFQCKAMNALFFTCTFNYLATPSFFPLMHGRWFKQSTNITLSLLSILFLCGPEGGLFPFFFPFLTLNLEVKWIMGNRFWPQKSQRLSPHLTGAVDNGHVKFSPRRAGMFPVLNAANRDWAGDQTQPDY